MGSTQPQSPISFFPDDWIILPQTASSYQHVRNIRNGQDGHLYRFDLSVEQNLQQQLAIYEWRSKTKNQHIVNVLQASVEEDSFNFCDQTKKIVVVTQRMPILLSDINITLYEKDENILLLGCLIGYKELYQRGDIRTLHETMVGINDSGCVRVWLNDNFAINSPPPQNEHYSNETICYGYVIGMLKKKFRQNRNDLFMKLEQAESFDQALEMLLAEKDVMECSDRKINVNVLQKAIDWEKLNSKKNMQRFLEQIQHSLPNPQSKPIPQFYRNSWQPSLSNRGSVS